MWVLVDDGAGAGVDVEGGWGACRVVYDDVVGGRDGVDGEVEFCGNGIRLNTNIRCSITSDN